MTVRKIIIEGISILVGLTYYAYAKNILTRNEKAPDDSKEKAIDLSREEKVIDDELTDVSDLSDSESSTCSDNEEQE